MIDQINDEKLENQLVEQCFDIQDYIEEKYYEYKNIFKIILLCFCLIIIIIPSSKKNIDNRTNQITLPNQKNEPVSKENKMKNQGNEERNKNILGNNKEPGIKQQDKEDSEKKPENKEVPGKKQEQNKEPEKKKDYKEEQEKKTDKNPSQKKEQKQSEGTDINDYNNSKSDSNLVNLYIITHKDFNNKAIFNQNYKILVDERSQLKKEYKLEIIPTNVPGNILYPKRIGYGECAKIYPIWKSYKTGNITSKYVGFFHYSRIFKFTNNIPDLDSIFQKFDAILLKRIVMGETNYQLFKRRHIVHFLDESVEIIKEKFPEYTPYCNKYLNKKWANFCNIFIMKKDDFIKWGELVYAVILELDRRYNLTTDEDIKNLMREELKNSTLKMSELDYQSRLEGFIVERIGGIFYEKHFKNIYEVPAINVNE